MLHRTVSDVPPASSKKEVSFKPGKGVGDVTSKCMGRIVRQFEKLVSFKVEEGAENVTSICMGRTVRQFDKEVSINL